MRSTDMAAILALAGMITAVYLLVTRKKDGIPAAMGALGVALMALGAPLGNVVLTLIGVAFVTVHLIFMVRNYQAKKRTFGSHE